MKVLVLSVRGLHAGYPGCYGNEWITTPALDRLAAGGVVFDQHLADVPEAAAARRAWRSGHYQLAALNAPDTVPPTPDLLEELRRKGVWSVLVADGSRPLPESLTQGWDQVEIVNSLTSEATFLEQTVETANATLRELKNEQWLLWVDLATLLPPWHVPAEFSEPYFREEEEPEEAGEDEEEEEPEEEVGEALVDEEPSTEEEEPEEPLTPWFDPAPGPINTEDDIDFARLQSSYAAAVSFIDAAVDALLEQLDKLGLSESCLVLLTSDHGQALGEHGIVGPYRPWLHDELIHVPLLLRLPASLAGEREVKGVRVAGLTQSPDIMPTLLEAFGLPIPEGVQGKSLLPLARQETAAVRDYACCGLRLGAASEWCLRTAEWGLVLPGEQELGDPPRGMQFYAKPDDRWEVNNVLQHHLERAEAFEQTLKEFVKAAAQPGALVPPPLRDAVEAGG
jgi:arylsulfatase A-like enzyme